MRPALAPNRKVTLPHTWWWGFVPFAALSPVHVAARAADADSIAGPTKLVLMPLLAAAALWPLAASAPAASAADVPPADVPAPDVSAADVSAPDGKRWQTPEVLLLAALLFSWVGDGAGAFFPQAPELPVMLGAFGLAHLCYIRLLWKYAAAAPFPRWALVFPLWWVLMLVLLWPTLGALTIAVALYGVVLGGTAATAARCTPMVAVGGVLFLASDTVLALRIFTPGIMPGWTSALVMLTYCAGQGLIVAGFLHRRRNEPQQLG